jgi:hypothetical protein
MHDLKSLAFEVLTVSLILYTITGYLMYAALPRLSTRQMITGPGHWSRTVIALGPFAWPAWRERWSRAVSPEDPANDWKRLVVRLLAWGGLVAIGLAATWIVVWQAPQPVGADFTTDDAESQGWTLVSVTMFAALLVIIPGALVAVNVAAILIRRERGSPL